MDFTQQIDSLRGPYSALFTPFDANNEINFEMVSQLVEFQLENGLNGFFVTGSTGEGLLLSEQERIDLTRHVVKLCRDRATVIAHVGHPSSDVAARLAQASAEAGADWIGAVGPIYHGTTFEGALRHYRQIAQATNLPFMIYALGTAIDNNRDQAFFDIPNVCAMKYTGANFFSVQQLARKLDRPVALLSGFDEQFVAGQSYGFQGGIGTTYNWAPQYYAGIYRNYHAGNIAEAARLQAEINKVTDLVVEPENWTYRKAVMKYIGFDCGSCRPPYAPITDDEYEAFASRLDELGVLQRADS